MSHHTTIATRTTDPDVARAALADLYPGATIEHSDRGTVEIVGYRGARFALAGVLAVVRGAGEFGTDVAITQATPGGSIVLEGDAYNRNAQRFAVRAAYHALQRAARASGLACIMDSTQHATPAAARRF